MPGIRDRVEQWEGKIRTRTWRLPWKGEGGGVPHFWVVSKADQRKSTILGVPKKRRTLFGYRFQVYWEDSCHIPQGFDFQGINEPRRSCDIFWTMQQTLNMLSFLLVMEPLDVEPNWAVALLKATPNETSHTEFVV